MKEKTPGVKKEGVFGGCTFALDYGTASYDAKKQIRTKITSNDGIISYIVTKKCQYLILLDDGSSSSSAQHLKSARRYGISAVSSRFIDSCLAEKRLVSPTDFLITYETEAYKNLKESFQHGKISNLEKNEEHSETTSSTGRQLKVWEFLDPGMPPFYNDQYALAKYTILKSQARLGAETTYASVEIHVQTKAENLDGSSSPKYSLFVYIGTIDEDSATSRRKVGSIAKPPSRTCRFTNDSTVVLDNYAKQLRTLTSPPRSMCVCSLIQDSIPAFVGSTEFQKILETLTVTQDQIDPVIKDLVGHVWMETFGIVGIDEPIHKTNISIKDVDEAENVLIEISDLLDRGSSVDELVSKYSSLIPQQKGVDLCNKQNVMKQRHYLQLYRDIIGVSEANPDGIAGAYKSLNCRINKVSEETSEYAAVTGVIGKDQTLRVKIINIYAVRRPIEDENFKFNLSNKQLLFHGSSFENFLGILSRGLLPARVLSDLNKEEIGSGNLGNGIYFTDSFLTSVGYSKPSLCRGSRLMVVAEVALGNYFETSVKMPHLTSPPDGYDSVKGVVGSDFKNNEFVVYDACQQRLTYLVEFRLEKDEITNTVVKPSANMDSVWTVKESLEYAKDSTSNLLSLEKILALKEIQLGSIKWKLEGQHGQTIPMKGVHVRAQIVDLAAKVVIIQEYFNNTSATLQEFKFVFPLEDETAVCGFEAFIGSKHVVGEVHEKKKAHQMYKEAIAKGHGGYLMDEEAPEMFSIMVGNLPPWTSVIIKITYISELATEGEHMAFRLPKGITQETPQIRESLEVGIEMPFVIRRISSPINHLKIKKTDTMATIQLASGERLCNGFELIIELAEIHVPRMWVEDHPETSSQACMLTFYPSFEVESLSTLGATVIIMLDASNSMKGELFEMAKIISLLCLHKIPSDWNFNVVIFGSVWEELFPVCQPKSLNNATAAKEFIERAEAEMGCTDVSLPLRALYLLPPSEGQFQNVFLVSDGQILSADSLVTLAGINKTKTRVFTLGVGSSKFPCEKHILKKFAYKGSGAFEEFDIAMKSKWIRKVTSQLQRASQPVITDVNVEWQQFDADAPTPMQSPLKFPPIFHGNRQLVFGFVSHCSLATLKAKIHGVKVSTIVSTSDLAKTKGKILHGLTARALIRDWNEGLQDEDVAINKAMKISKKWEIIELSKQYGVLSPLTSFVAIEVRNEDERDKSVTGKSVANLLTTEAVDRLDYIEFPQEDVHHMEDSYISDFDNFLIERDSIENFDCGEEWSLEEDGKEDGSADERERSSVVETRPFGSRPQRWKITNCAIPFDTIFPIDPKLLKSGDQIGRSRSFATPPLNSGFRICGTTPAMTRAVVLHSDTGMKVCGLPESLALQSSETLSEETTVRKLKKRKDRADMVDEEIGFLKAENFQYTPQAKQLALKVTSAQVDEYETNPCSFDSVECTPPPRIPPPPVIPYQSRSSSGMLFGASSSASRIPPPPHCSSKPVPCFPMRPAPGLAAVRWCDLAKAPIADEQEEMGCMYSDLSPAQADSDEMAPRLLNRAPPMSTGSRGGTGNASNYTCEYPMRFGSIGRGARKSSFAEHAERDAIDLRTFGASKELTDLSFDCLSVNQPALLSHKRSRKRVASHEIELSSCPQFVNRRKVDRALTISSTAVPVCVIVKQYLIGSDYKVLTDLVKTTLKKGWSDSETGLKAFQASLKSELQSGTTFPTGMEMWTKQQSDGAFDSPSNTDHLIAILDKAGIKSLGSSVKNFVFRMCCTIEALLKTFINLGADLSTGRCESPELQTTIWAEEWLNALDQANSTLFIHVLMAIAYVIWVNDRHPLIFKTLQLKNLYSCNNWETFVFEIFQMDKS